MLSVLKICQQILSWLELVLVSKISIFPRKCSSLMEWIS
jgi:hypothetical protein